MRWMRMIVLVRVFGLAVNPPQDRGEAPPRANRPGARGDQAHSERENH